MINFVDYYIHYTERLHHINNAVLNAPSELIRQMEEQYAKRINEIADFVMSTGKGRKLIMLSGPSSSGKTTTANMLVSCAKSSGVNAVCLSLDDFFKGEGKAPRLPDGNYDYESVYALDIDLMKQCLTELLEKGSTMMPRFDFAAKGPEPERYPLNVGENDVVIVEGIHALNPIITDCLPDERMVKIYISVKQGIKEGDETVISAHQIRFLRRLVRDYQFRNSPPERTFEMWPQVLRGEKLYISAYKRHATVTINSIHIYEVNAIADRFCHYYRYHITKEVTFYRDRYGDIHTANAKKSYNEMFIDRLTKNGWKVTQRVHPGIEPPQHDKFLLWQYILSESDERFPIVRINATRCPKLVISMQNTAVTEDSKGRFTKNKSSERKKSIAPEEATHFGDTFDKCIWTKYGSRLKIINNTFVSARV